MTRSNARSRRPTKSELLAWLGQGLRTWNWDAVVAYDSEVLNQVLREEYVKRSSAGTYIEPINTTIPLIPNSLWLQLHDYQFDAPRLSFEATTLEDSLATFTIYAISGLELQVARQGAGPKHVSIINHVHPLQGTRARGRIPLQMAAGKADIAGNMKISLAEGMDLEVRASDVEAYRRLIGHHLTALFSALHDDQKVFTLSNVGAGQSTSIINPEQFAIRARCAPGADRPGAANFGAGEVMMFIAMKGSPTPSTPVSSSVFLVPEGSSCTVLLSNHLMTRQLVERGQSPWTNAVPAIEYVDPALGAKGPIRSVTITGSAMVHHPDLVTTTTPGSTPLHWSRIMSDLAAPAEKASFTLAKLGETLEIYRKARVSYRLSDLRIGADFRNCSHNFIARRTFSVHPQGLADLELVAYEGEDIEELQISTVGREGVGEAADIRAPEIMYEYAAKCLRDTLDHFAKPASAMLAHKLLMFPHDEAALHSDTVHFPHDLAMFCDLPPPEGSFRVEPNEAMLGAGGQLKFSTVGAIRDVSWTVRSEGSTAAGCISACGEYIAPGPDAIDGAFSVVYITATAADGFQAAAMLRVLAQDVVVNPLVSLADASRPTRLRINALDDAPVEIALDGAGSGTLRVSPAAADEEPGYWYQPSRTAGAFGVDTITVTNLRSGCRVQAHVLVNADTATASVRVTRIGRGQYRLTLFTSDGPCTGVTWTLRAGGGRLDPVKGIYRPGRLGRAGYAVISGSTESDNAVGVCGWIILPIVMLDELALPEAPWSVWPTAA
ncbi:hypothetical protein [Stenotrophomonas rhizophila]|uniref:hypothetical protein n=1 Tax=Stenotrophomonas rhizophila TaxID=216778 RepID=UPI001AEC31B5|nr:hypothetical protein [Stenotrophomonas rhizophila]